MIDLRFRIRNTIFGANLSQRTAIRQISLYCSSIEEAALLGDVDESGKLVPNREVFLLSFPKSGPVIEGFTDSAIGEFVKAQIEAHAQGGEPPSTCEMRELDPFLEPLEPEQAERIRDLISVCEFRNNEFTPESAIRFLKEAGFFDEYIIVGVKRGNGWRRSRCITTYEGRPADAATILGYLAEYFQNQRGSDKPQDDQHH